MRRILTLFSVLAALYVSAAAQVTFTKLVDFNGGNGTTPSGPLIQASDGNFYGNTSGGGAYGFGTVYRVTPSGTLTTLHSFDYYANPPEGLQPDGPLLQAKDGYLYGTAFSGGAGHKGTVFRISTGGALSVVYSFCTLDQSCSDGSMPSGGVIQASDGNFYGTTFQGGQANLGTVYRLTASGVLTTIHSFVASGGYYPRSTLVQGTDGYLYGTTKASSDFCSPACGTIFKVSLDGAFTVLYTFCSQDGCPDGSQPGSLIVGSDGNLYGGTSRGGSYGGGTSFRLTYSGNLTTLYSFCSQWRCGDGGGPGRQLQAADGIFYGVTPSGGASYLYGTLFRMGAEGGLLTLHDFFGDDGAFPIGLVHASDGGYYGTTSRGGTRDQGTIFSFTADLSQTLAVLRNGPGTVSSGDARIYCGAQYFHQYEKGEQARLTATPSVGRTLTQWSGCDSVAGRVCTVIFSGERSVTATFDLVQVNLSSLTFNPSIVKGGQMTVATLTLSEAAPPGGVAIQVMSFNQNLVQPPSAIVIPGGQTSYSFAVRTSPVRKKIKVQVEAAANDSYADNLLTLDTQFHAPSVAVRGGSGVLNSATPSIPPHPPAGRSGRAPVGW